MSIGSRIKEAREKAGLSQAELGRKIKVTRAAINQLENGTSKSPNSGNLLTIAAALGVSPTWLQTGKGPRESHPQESTDIHRPAKDTPNPVKESDTSATHDQSGKEDTTLPKNSQRILRLFNKLSPEKQLEALTHLLDLAEDEDEGGRKSFIARRP